MRTGAVVLLLMGALAACGGEAPSGPGCQAPPNESKLLDDYAADPVFGVQPPDARKVSGPERIRACVANGEDVSSAAAIQRFELTRDYRRDDLVAAYDQAARSRGWAAASPDGPVAGLRYCKRIRGVTSFLNITAHDSRAVDVRASTGARPSEPVLQTRPGELFVSITAVLTADC